MSELPKTSYHWNYISSCYKIPLFQLCQNRKHIYCLDSAGVYNLLVHCFVLARIPKMSRSHLKNDINC